MSSKKLILILILGLLIVAPPAQAKKDELEIQTPGDLAYWLMRMFAHPPGAGWNITAYNIEVLNNLTVRYFTYLNRTVINETETVNLTVTGEIDAGCNISSSGNLTCPENITAKKFYGDCYGDWNGSSLYVPYTGATANVDLGTYDFTTTGSIITTGGGKTGKFLTGSAGYTVFAFSGGGLDIRAGTGGSYSQNVLRVTSAGHFDFYDGNLITTGAMTASAFQISTKRITVTTYTRAGIQAALNALGSDGGEVYMPEAEYVWDNTSLLPAYDNIKFTGSGAGTIWKVPDGLDSSNLIIINLSERSNIILADFMIDGNRANNAGQQRGIYMDGGSGHKLINLWIVNIAGSNAGVGGDGIYVDGVPTDILISGCTVDNIGDDGMDVNAMVKSRVVDNYINNTGDNAIDTEGAEWLSMNDNTVENCGGHGIELEQEGSGLTKYSTVTGNTIENVTKNAIHIESGGRNTVSANTIKTAAIGIYLGATGTGDMAKYNSIIGNVISSSDDCIKEEAGDADYNDIINNKCKGCTTNITIVGSHTRVMYEDALFGFTFNQNITTPWIFAKTNASNVQNPPWLTSYTETDPHWTGNQSLYLPFAGAAANVVSTKNATFANLFGVLPYNNITPCSNTEILKVSGGEWVCDIDATGGGGAPHLIDMGTYFRLNETYAEDFNISNGSLTVSNLISCDTTNTYANGTFYCGDDETGGGGTGAPHWIAADNELSPNESYAENVNMMGGSILNWTNITSGDWGICHNSTDDYIEGNLSGYVCQ